MDNKLPVPIRRRRYMIPFVSHENTDVSMLLIHTTDYNKALTIAKCICGDAAEKSLCYKDFTIYD